MHSQKKIYKWEVLSAALFVALLFHLVPVIMFYIFKEVPIELNNIELNNIELEIITEINAQPLSKDVKTAETISEEIKPDQFGFDSSKLIPTEAEKVDAPEPIITTKLKNKRVSWRTRLKVLEKEAHDFEASSERLTEKILSTVEMNSQVKTTTNNCLNKIQLKKLKLENRQNIGRLAFLLPNGVFPSGYLEKVIELYRRFDRASLRMKLLLPAEVIAIPTDVKIHEKLFMMGHPNMMCQIEIHFSPKLFPVHFKNMPLWHENVQGKVELFFVHLALSLDGNIKIYRAGASQKKLPNQIMLRKREELKRNLRSQYELFLSLRRLFGPK